MSHPQFLYDNPTAGTQVQKSKRNKNSETKLFQTVFFDSEDGFVLFKVILDENGEIDDLRFLEVNPASEKQTGVKAEKVVGKTLKETFPDLEKYWYDKFSEVIKSGKTVSYEEYNQSTKRTYSARYMPFPNNQLGVIFKDITEQRQAVEALKESEERYRTLFSNMGEAFALHEMLFDKEGVPVDYRFLEVNKAFERQTGLRASQIIGKTVCKILPDLEPFWMETYGKVVITGEPVRFENYNQSTNRYYEVYAFRPAKDRFGVIFSDITVRKQMQIKLEKYATNLEQLVEERTKQLRESEHLATIGQTASMVGHDIRNPLQAITGDLYLIEEEIKANPKCISKEILESILAINQNIVYINKIVSDLQDYTRTLKPSMTTVDLRDTIDNALAGRKVPENIRVQLLSTELKLRTDPIFLRRIITNLITNAIQAMPKGGTLTIDGYINDKVAQIFIQDTGVGIPEEIKHSLFTPLFTTKAKGQGLGLAVVRRLVEALGGTIGFESEIGKGTKFTIELPRD